MRLTSIVIRNEIDGSAFQLKLLSNQITQDDGLYFPPKLYAIQCSSAAIDALEIVIEQGEGANAEDPNSHIYKFNHMVVPVDGVHPLVENPSVTHANYTNNPNLLSVRVIPLHEHQTT